MLHVNQIKKVISYNQSFHVDLSGLKEQLEMFSNRYQLDMNPNFQRGHVWDESRQIKLVEYILKGGKIPDILFNRHDFKMVLVDGKQRLTAILKFLDNELPVFGGYYLKDIQEIEVLLLTTTICFGINQLTSNDEIINWYVQINEGQVAHTEDEILLAKSFLSGELNGN